MVRAFKVTDADRAAVRRSATATKAGLIAAVGTALARKGTLVPDWDTLMTALGAAWGLGYGKRHREQVRTALRTPLKEDS